MDTHKRTHKNCTMGELCGQKSNSVAMTPARKVTAAAAKKIRWSRTFSVSRLLNGTAALLDTNL